MERRGRIEVVGQAVRVDIDPATSVPPAGGTASHSASPGYPRRRTASARTAQRGGRPDIACRHAAIRIPAATPLPQPGKGERRRCRDVSKSLPMPQATRATRTQHRQREQANGFHARQRRRKVVPCPAAASLIECQPGTLVRPTQQVDPCRWGDCPALLAQRTPCPPSRPRLPCYSSRSAATPCTRRTPPRTAPREPTAEPLRLHTFAATNGQHWPWTAGVPSAAPAITTGFGQISILMQALRVRHGRSRATALPGTQRDHSRPLGGGAARPADLPRAAISRTHRVSSAPIRHLRCALRRAIAAGNGGAGSGSSWRGKIGWINRTILRIIQFIHTVDTCKSPLRQSFQR